jgi:Zn finger protein HypA/HybF involved in hydrogenase expression
MLAFVVPAFSTAESGASRAVRQCAKCHAAQANSHSNSSMAHAMELVSKCAILKTHPLLTFTDGRYSYRIERKGVQSVYSVTDGRQTITATIGWAFGLGLAGQTYVFEKDGEFYESRVSYYRELDGLDLTTGAVNRQPTSIIEAGGRRMDAEDKAGCFGCHATNATHGKKLTLDDMTAGIQCERCHGPAESHLQGLKQRNPTMAKMTRLRSMSTEETSHFCGQCHRTWEDVAGGAKLGILNVRFQPYRLTNSKCYDSDDARISCVACHDPHQELDRTVSLYDSKCRTCHGGGKVNARACKVSQHGCGSCHMPKLEMPGSHHKFTDHEIRIVRANAPYPD